jgi:hypothetical protein
MNHITFYLKTMFFVVTVLIALPFLVIESIVIGLAHGTRDFSRAIKHSYLDMHWKHYNENN